MKKLIEEMEQGIEVLAEELKGAETNKSAAARARKATLHLAELGKQFRKFSVAFHKK